MHTGHLNQSLAQSNCLINASFRCHHYYYYYFYYYTRTTYINCGAH